MGRSRILVVDDSATIRRVVSQVLRSTGYEVATADNGAAGVVEARAARPTLILLDHSMPGMSPAEFLHALRTHTDPGQHAPAVVLMAARGEHVEEAVRSNVDVVDTITKPFSPDMVLAVVSHCLEKHQGGAREVTGVRPRATSEPAPGRVSSGSTASDAATRAFGVLGRLLADALAARGIAAADTLAASILTDLRRGLGPNALATALATAAHQPRAGLSGDLSQVPLPEVLQLLKFQGHTGLLEVALDGEGHDAQPARFAVAVQAGLVVAVRANNHRADLLLGNYFVGGGFVARAQLDALLERPSQVPVGQRLAEAGLITTEQLRRCVGQQAQDLVVELLRARRGTFTLRTGEDALPSMRISPGFPIDVLLIEALRYIDEWGVIEQEVPSFHARFLRLSADTSDLSAEEIEVLSHLSADEPRDIHDLLRSSSLRAFDACKLVYRLAVTRRVKRTDDGRTGDRRTGDATAPLSALVIESSPPAGACVAGE